MRWYALRVFHNKVFQAEEALMAASVECYVPTTTEVVERDGERVRRKRPVIPSLMFVRVSRSQLAAIESMDDLNVRAYTRFDGHGRRIPAPIPDREMQVFILVSSSGEQGLEYFDADSAALSVGSRVRVVGGVFKGSEGYIKRIKGNRRFIVRINGVCAVATPYIPVAFLEKVDD